MIGGAFLVPVVLSFCIGARCIIVAQRLKRNSRGGNPPSWRSYFQQLNMFSGGGAVVDAVVVSQGDDATEERAFELARMRRLSERPGAYPNQLLAENAGLLPDGGVKAMHWDGQGHEELGLRDQ